MNRSERRKHAKTFKNAIDQTLGTPKSHLHDAHSQADLDKTKEEVRKFLKTYDYKGSAYEADIEAQKSLGRLIEQSNAHIAPIRLSSNYEIKDEQSGQIINTEVYLIKHENGWFIHYPALSFFQNVLVLVLESGFGLLMSAQSSICRVTVLGKTYLIPNGHKLARQAFDSLSLKFEDRWLDV